MAQPTDHAKMLAVLAYGGFFFGFPLGVIPLLMREDEFSVFHGRHATASWILHFGLLMVLTAIVSAIAFVTCGFGGILFPVLFVPVVLGAITSLHGVVLALNGEQAEPIGGLGLGDLLFAGVTAKVSDVAPRSLPALPDHGDEGEG